jgi:hypothetical protein
MSLEEIQQQLATLQRENERLQHRLTQDHSASSAPQVNRVAVKLPPFWSDRPSLWFAQADSQFFISNITNDETKFHYVISQLDTRYAAEVEYIISNPPATDKYITLRTKLVERLSASEEQRVRQLISDEELGERRPSQFLRHLRSLAGATAFQDNFLRQLWLRRLPPQAQAILTTQMELSLDKLADLADKIVEVAHQPLPTGIAVNATTAPDSGNALLFAIESLSKQVAELSTNVRRRERSNSRSNLSRHSSRDRSTSQSLCWYHNKFGSKATKCKSPCDFQENSNSSQ